MELLKLVICGLDKEEYNMFYFDDNLKKYELECSWDKALLYLERLFQEQPTPEKLNSLVGFAWYYLIEGPIDSGKYGNDENYSALDIWKKYIGIGLKKYLNDAGFCFITGYSLLMNGFYIEEYKKNYEQVGLNLLEEVNNSTVDNLKEIVNIVFEYKKQKKYKPLKVKHEVLEQIFNGGSLLEEYFKELYS